MKGEKSIYNKASFAERRQRLRTSPTEAENLLWARLRKKQINGLRFFRQYSIGPYILDFYCPAVRLAVELDGKHHASEENRLYDKERKLYLDGNNIKTIRFWNDEIIKSMESILKKIKSLCSLP